MGFSQVNWEYRGSKAMCDASEERLQAMHDYFDKANADLQASLKLSTKPILAYVYSINVPAVLGETSKKKQLIERTFQLDPNNARARRIFMSSLRPEWGGSYEAMSAFVVETKRFAETLKLREIVASLEGDVLIRHSMDNYVAKDYAAALDYAGRALALREDTAFLVVHSASLAQLKRHREAIADLNRAIELNPNLIGAYELRAEIFVQLQENANALADFRVAAERGNALSQHALGAMYFTGKGVAKNNQEALKWLRLAANQGDANAQTGYAYMLSRGLGTDRNDSEAMEWWRRAARQGHERARKRLGTWELIRLEVETNFEKFISDLRGHRAGC